MIVTHEMFDDVENELDAEKKEKVSRIIKHKYRMLEYIRTQIVELEEQRDQICDELDEIDGMEFDDVIKEYGDCYGGVVSLTLENSFRWMPSR